MNQTHNYPPIPLYQNCQGKYNNGSANKYKGIKFTEFGKNNPGKDEKSEGLVNEGRVNTVFCYNFSFTGEQTKRKVGDYFEAGD